MRDSSKNNQTFGGAGPAVPVNNSQLTNDLEAQIEANNKLKEMVAKLTDAIHTQINDKLNQSQVHEALPDDIVDILEAEDESNPFEKESSKDMIKLEDKTSKAISLMDKVFTETVKIIQAKQAEHQLQKPRISIVPPGQSHGSVSENEDEETAIVSSADINKRKSTISRKSKPEEAKNAATSQINDLLAALQGKKSSQTSKSQTP